MTPKDRNLIKGALRRVFARSTLRYEVLSEAIVKYEDSSRPKVKTWAQCSRCLKIDAKSYMQVDHVIPVIPLDRALEDMTWDEVIARLWCDKKYLAVLCISCHDYKTKVENTIRKEHKRARKVKRDMELDSGSGVSDSSVSIKQKVDGKRKSKRSYKKGKSGK
jgi:5-methylcytosine-specific restriction endonuclease McrA